MVTYFILGVLALMAVVIFIIVFNFFQLWLQALLSGVHVPWTHLIAMRLRKVPPATIVLARINAVKAGLNLNLNDLEALYLAGGNVPRVVQALIAAHKGDFELSFEEATALDLQGEDVLERVKNAVMCAHSVAIDGRPFNARISGGPIEVGTLLRVSAVDGTNLTVDTVTRPGAD